jgi:hypothetical protein
MALGENPIDGQNSPEQVELDQGQGAQAGICHESVGFSSAESRANIDEISAFPSTTYSDDSGLSLTTFYAYALFDAQTAEPSSNSRIGYAVGVLVVLVISVVAYLQSFSTS